MRSRLLTETVYSDLIAKASIEEVITALTETPYKEDVEVALVRVGGVRCVFEALRANLTRTLRQVREFFEGEPRTRVDILLRRWDRHNLLTILRGQSQEVPPETVLSATVPVGQLDQVSLREMARQPDLKAAIDLMATWRLPYADVLRSVRACKGTIPDLDQLEMALNRFHYACLRETLSRGNGDRAILNEHLQVEIDLVNISTALRLARLPGIAALVRQRYNAADVRPLLIEPGGHLRTERLVQLVAEADELEGVVRGLSDTRYGLALGAGWKRYQSGESNFAVFERELERWQAERTAAMFTRDPLSIAIPIGYLGCKEVEVANLRLIAQAVALDMKREQARRDLIIV
jgi:vacuolar-type H+-ATPase subunit C/Vma6